MPDDIYVALVDQDSMGRHKVVYAGPSKKDAERALERETYGKRDDHIERWRGGELIQSHA